MIQDHHSGEESNFWPSICDLFLVFFICALVIAGLHANQAKTTTEEIKKLQAESTRGDTLSMEDFVFELRCFLALISENASTAMQLSYSVEDYIQDQAEFGSNYQEYPRLIAVLTEAYMSTHWEPNPQYAIKKEQKFLHLSDIVHALRERVGIDELSDADNMIALKVIMRRINEALRQSKAERFANEIQKMQAKLGLTDSDEDYIKIDNEMRKVLIALTGSRGEADNAELLKKLKELHVNGKFEVAESVLNEDMVAFEEGEYTPIDSTIANNALAAVRVTIREKLQKARNIAPDYKLYIEVCGHTNERGRKADNADLGLNRALAIKYKLESKLESYERSQIVWRVRSAGEMQLYHDSDKSRADNLKYSRRIGIKMWPGEAPKYELGRIIPDGSER